MINFGANLKGLITGVYEFIAALCAEFIDKGCQKSAAALTYMSLFALVPVMTVVYSMFSIVPAFDGIAERLQTLVFSHFVPETGQEVQTYLASFSEQARSLTGFGIAILVVTAYLMLTNIEKTFNTIWGVKSARKGLSGFLLYWAVLSIGPLFVGMGLVASTYLISLKLMASELADQTLIAVLFKLLPVVLSAAAFTLLFVAVPNCKVPLKYGLVGGVTTALCFEMVKSLFTAIVANSSFKLIYGAFAAVPLFLLWINVLWTIILIGALFVRTLTERHFKRKNIIQNYWRGVLACLSVFFEKSHTGGVVRDIDCVEQGVSLVEWQRIRQSLLDQRIIVVTDSGQYVLQRHLEKITLLELILALGIPLNQLHEASTEDSTNSWLAKLGSMEVNALDKIREELSIPVSELFESLDKSKK